MTAGLGADEIAAEFAAAHDDYSSIMVKAIADRLAEAFAEYLHARARHEWGYEVQGELTSEDLIAERYRGIRPAFGYPACPDHSPTRELFRILDAEAIGMSLSESLAMLPAASVSGIYLAHPEARYFAVGPIGADQVADYAARQGRDLDEVERALAPQPRLRVRPPGGPANPRGLVGRELLLGEHEPGAIRALVQRRELLRGLLRGEPVKSRAGDDPQCRRRHLTRRLDDDPGGNVRILDLGGGAIDDDDHRLVAARTGRPRRARAPRFR